MGANQSTAQWIPDDEVKSLDEYLVEYGKDCDRRAGYKPDQHAYRVIYKQLKCSNYKYNVNVATEPDVTRSAVILFQGSFANKMDNADIEHVMRLGIKRKYTNETTVCTTSGWVVSHEIEPPILKYSAHTIVGEGFKTKLYLASKQRYNEQREKEITFDTEVTVKPSTLNTVTVKLEGAQYKRNFTEDGFYHGKVVIEVTTLNNVNVRYIGPVSLFDICNQYQVNAPDIRLDMESKMVILSTTREITVNHFLGKEKVEFDEEKYDAEVQSNGSFSYPSDTSSINSGDFTPRSNKFKTPVQLSRDSGINLVNGNRRLSFDYKY